MKFGCNYSRELISILEEDSSFCDYIKMGAFGKGMPLLEEVFRYKPLLLHGFGWHERGGMSSVDVMDFELMNRLLIRYRTPFLGMHALSFDEDVQRIEREKDLADHMAGIFKEVKERLSIPLLIENLDFSPFYEYATTVKESVLPDFLTKVIHSSECGLLFDLSHARVSAFQLNMDIKEYIEGLPLEKMKEIHFSGSFYSKNEGFKDIHGIMNEDDFEIAQWIASHPRVLAAKNLEIITLEYGTFEQADRSALLMQMNRLKDIFRN